VINQGRFPGFQREQDGGNWYRSLESDLEGWLCPALLMYFYEAPEKLYDIADPQIRMKPPEKGA
jgi:hypothetical protein